MVIDWIGAKASAGEQTGEHCYYIMPTGACHLVRSFRTLKTKVTKSVRTLTAPGQTVQSLVSLRQTLQAGVFRDGSGLAGAPASAVASASLSLLADEARRGGTDNPDRYLVFVDPISGTPLRLILTSIDGHLARMEKGKAHRRDGA